MNSKTLITKEGWHVLKDDTHISRWVEEHKNLTCDPYLFKWLLPKLQDVKVVWDLGAFIGDHTLSYLSLPNIQKVHAFEPHPDSFYCLERNVGELSKREKKARCWNVAASDHRDKLSLLCSSNTGASRLADTGDCFARAVRLDTFMQGSEDPDFIKIDVEGWELRALAGMKQTIARAHPKAFVEVNKGALAANGNTPEDLMKFFTNRGYDFEVYPENASHKDEQYDLFFFPHKDPLH